MVKALVERKLTPKKVAVELGISYHRSLKLFKEYGFPLQGSGGQNRKVKGNPFSNLEDEKVQYFLGLIAADGWIGAKNSVWLGLKDLDMMKKYAAFLGDVTIHGKDKYHSTYRVGFGNKETVEFLNGLGITKRKTFTLKINEKLLTNHFIRGYFDGDGYAPAKGQSAKITSSSKCMLELLKKALKREGIKTSIRVQEVKVNTSYALYITGKQRDAFASYLYKNATIYLSRKLKRFQAQVKSGELLGTLK